jgi:hypothetical protein
MRKGDLLADLVTHGAMSQTIVKLHGWSIQERLMGLVMRSACQFDDEVHFYLRPHPLARDGILIQLEIVGEEADYCGRNL